MENSNFFGPTSSSKRSPKILASPKERAMNLRNRRESTEKRPKKFVRPNYAIVCSWVTTFGKCENCIRVISEHRIRSTWKSQIIQNNYQPTPTKMEDLANEFGFVGRFVEQPYGRSNCWLRIVRRHSKASSLFRSDIGSAPCGLPYRFNEREERSTKQSSPQHSFPYKSKLSMNESSRETMLDPTGLPQSISKSQPKPSRHRYSTRSSSILLKSNSLALSDSESTLSEDTKGGGNNFFR